MDLKNLPGPEFLTEIARCALPQDDHDFSGSRPQCRKGTRFRSLTDVDSRSRRKQGRPMQSPNEPSGGINSTEEDEERRKVATLDPRTINTEERPPCLSEPENTEKNLCSGMLYKTSRGKITSDLTRCQHEHRQHRRFKLTEHSLEYSHLLQRVCMHVTQYNVLFKCVF